MLNNKNLGIYMPGSVPIRYEDGNGGICYCTTAVEISFSFCKKDYPDELESKEAWVLLLASMAERLCRLDNDGACSRLPAGPV